MKTGSSSIAIMPATSVTAIDRQASPAARRIDAPVIPSAMNGIAGLVTRRKRLAAAAASPRAPAAASSGSRKTTTTAATAACTRKVMTSAEVAPMRAPSRSPSPSARLTSAVAATASPMPEEMMKKITVQAKPSPATSRSSPSRASQKSVAASMRNMKVSPMAPVSVITTTWRKVEPSVKRAAAGMVAPSLSCRRPVGEGRRSPHPRRRRPGHVASTFSNCQGSLSSISSANCGHRVEIGVQSV